ncbi:MAG: glycoside hydrolase family 9 protein [Ruminococcus sp.]|nr:glycoside hydrolase family 9 protein [Ruminococcus sp.]
MKHSNIIWKKITAASASAVIAATSALSAATVTTTGAEDNNYYEALAMSLYMYDANACGKGITDGPLTWRGDCHTYDAEASVGSLDGSLKSVVDPDGDGKVDVSGGFHDAGDHIKFNLTIGFGISSLALSDYLNPGIYEKAGCKDHLIYELKWGADYLMKTTFLDNSGNVAAIAHVVANGTEDHAIWSAPEVQTYARPIYWLTANKNNSAVCCEMAAGLAGTAYVVKESDPDYAAKCIKYAKALLEFGQKHVGNEGGGLSEYYGTEAQYQDEEALAQAWLWVCDAGSKPTRVPKNKDYGNSQYDGWVYCWNKVWQGYSALMYKATGDQAFADELKVELQSQGDLTVGTYNADGWGASRYNCAKQMDALALANGNKDAEYAKAAKYQMDHILGNNSLGYSFLLGYGSKWPVHIHHRAANPGTDANGASSNPSAKYTAYGLLVGGDDKSGYQDQTDKYQYTEGALDYNGCFAIACAGIAALYGGDASAMDKLAKSADEINENFKFGNGENNTTTTETTTVTTTTTSVTTSSVTTTVTTTEAPLITITLIPELVVQEVISYPSKTVYAAGEELDLSGVSVKARYETRWFEAEGSRAGTMYGESKIYDNITLDPGNAIVRNGSSTWWYGDKFSTLEPGDYTVNYSSDASTSNGEKIRFNSFRFPVTLKADSGIPQYSYVFTVKDKETGELINNATLTFSTHIVYEIDGREVSTGPLFRYNTADANPVVYNYAKYKDAKSHSVGDIHAEADGYTFVEAMADIRDGGAPDVTYMDVLMVKGNAAAIAGDTNLDGQVDMADAVLIMQSLANPNKYGVNGTDEKHITQLGIDNGDADKNGLTNNDAQAIQKLLLGLIKSLTTT